MKKTTKQKQMWFLETSVHINRLMGHSLLKQKIKTTTETQLCYTSFFVFYEFKRCVVKTLISLYYTVLEEESLADAFFYYKENFQTRENKIVLGAVGALLLEDDLGNDKQKLLANLETLIIASLQNFYDNIKDFVTNQAKCPLSKASIDKSFEEFLVQIKCEANCTIAKFWKKHRKILELLTQQELIRPHRKNKGFIDKLPLLRKLLDDCEAGQTIRNCSKLADVIIAIEMPKKQTMLTFDKSFESLCPLMEKQVKRLPSLKELKQQFAQQPE